MKLLRFPLFLIVATALFAGGNGEIETGAGMGRTTDLIRKSGVIRIGVHFDLPKMGLLDSKTGEYNGFEIEVARLLARDLLGDEDKIAFVPVTTENRETLLDRGTVDVVIATFGKTDQVAANYNVSSPYYIDFIGLMARKDAGIQGLVDLNQRSIGVAAGTNTRLAIDAVATTIGVRPNFYEFSRFAEIKAALDSGLLDIFASNRVILARYTDDFSVILPDVFAPREYGIATKLSNSELAAYVELRVQQWQREGIFEALKGYFEL
jgi:putative glutamine transport system substrate-binding protein